MTVYLALVADGSGLMFDAKDDAEASAVAEAKLRQQCGKQTIVIRRADKFETQVWQWEQEQR
jgi:hypothetical protein